MDLGARWNLHVSGLGSSPFDIDNPCAIIPSETITVGSEAQSVDMTLTCGDLFIDTDGDESAVPSSGWITAA